MEIRRARQEDIDRLLDLLRQVLKTHVELRPDIFVAGSTKYREEELLPMVRDDDKPIYVITVENRVMGYAFCQIKVSKTPHLTKRRKSFFIDDFCIDEAARRQHLGEALFAFLKNEAKRLGCDEITLHCWNGNVPAENFYAKMGFKPKASILEFKID